MKVSRRQPKPCEPKVVVEQPKVEEKPPVIKKKVGKK
jgi:hypothetical protein